SQLPQVRLLGVGDDAAAPAQQFTALRDAQPTELMFGRELNASTIAAYYHTGGTTGAPKLALHTHRNQVHTSWFAGMFYGLTPDDCLINGFPLFHVAGAFVFGSACFCAGATLLMPPRTGMRHQAFVKNYWRFVERYRASYLAAVPTVISALLQVPAQEADLSSVRALYTGGSPLPTELAANFERTFGVPVRNILGMTESAGLVCIEPLAAPRHPLSCGLRLPYTQVFAIKGDAEAADLLDRCEVNEPGIIVIAGPHVSPGYSDPRRNAGMFAATGELISGDLGHVDEASRVSLTGRAKDVIIRGAHNIDPLMIEEAFIKHPDVAACAAVGEPDRHAGELPVVFLSLKQGATSDANAILAAVAPSIAERAAIPKRVTILDALPTTAIGKIFKPALRLLAVEHAYREALIDLQQHCRQWQLQAVQQAGGMKAIVSVWGAQDRARAQGLITERLGQLVVPYEVAWREG
ncbi:MAG: AMP-binding protein, partial [Quisquiliibacterium sp.]